MMNLSFLTVIYRNYKTVEGKKTLGLIDHMVRNELKYSAKVAKFAHRMGEIVTELDQALKSLTP